MSSIVIRGGHLVTPTEERIADLILSDGLISSIGVSDNKLQSVENIDATGCWVTPGLIDLQVNGGPACDFWADPSPAQVKQLAEELAAAGVTTILPTLITDELEHLSKNIAFVEGLQKQQLAVRMPGIHLEGPCLSPERPGVHPKQHIQPLTMAVAKQLAASSVKLITLAPELDPSGECVAFFRSKGIEVALGHSNATYDEAKAAFDADVRMMTHTYNALPPIHHRAPGAVVAALLDRRVMCCLICDGQHVSPPAAELVIRTKGVNGTILVTDIAHVGTSQGGLVGSSIMLDEAVRNVVNWGIATFQQAILMSSYNPAKAMGWQDLGELAIGKKADVLVWDRATLALKHVIADGKVLGARTAGQQRR
jgi:N-acetylglucosamine-6-phosphate deacetylase